MLGPLASHRGGGAPAEFAGLFTGTREPTDGLRWTVSKGQVDVFVEERQVAFPDTQPWVDREDRVWTPLRFAAEALDRVAA
ncbi:MAG: hypothetical protein AB1816_03670 [Bacillota bacterium]